MTPKQAVAVVKKYGAVLTAARALGVDREVVRRPYDRAVKMGLAKPASFTPVKIQKMARDAEKKPVVGGRVHYLRRDTMPLPQKGAIRRYIVTCAQNNTAVHGGLWRNLMVLRQARDAQILVSRFTYNKDAFGQSEVKPGTKNAGPEQENLWYAPEIADFVCDRSVQLAPGLVWCGELNILPTAVRPLSGFEAYTGRQSAIIPHPKLAMESIASGKFEATKFNYTTGTVTQRNYIQKKAGQKAEFHHCYGALLAEVDSDGSWFVRQLNADSEGTIYDLDTRVKDGQISHGHRAAGVNWGDTHVGYTDPTVARLGWEAEDSMMAILRPRHQFVNDVLDFHSQNHHERGNPHKRFERHMGGQSSVAAEIVECALFLAKLAMVAPKDCLTVVVNSNHDNALERWLREGDYRTDPENALFFLEAQLHKYRTIAAGDKTAHTLEWAIRRVLGSKGSLTPRGFRHESLRFLREDESFILCPDANGGIESGMHGHLGPNGAKGSAGAFARMGRKANVGHTHTTGIFDGIYTAGTSSVLDMGYNRGPSSWSHSHIITYANGKRAIVTMWRGKWRA